MNDIDVLDMSIVAEGKASMKAKFPTMVQYFLEDTESYLAAIREGIAAASSEKIISPTHTLKSSSRQMGAMRLSVIAKKMEEKAREQAGAGSNDMAPFATGLAQLEAAFAETKTAYQNMGT